MRLRRPTEDTFPDELRRYRPEDWTGRGCHAQCAYYEALHQWIDDHPDQSVPELDDPPRAFYPEHI